jgi:pentatricopeptide repeat protein
MRLWLCETRRSHYRICIASEIAYTAAIASCGKAGQLDHAVRLFQEMLEQGLSPDRVAYNSLFTAFRVSSEGILAFELWSDMVSKRLTNSNSKRVSPRADDLTSPDIITVTEAIAAMNRGGLHEKVDMVFADAVQLGILFQDDSFDTCWEVDLTKMSLSVARAACRFILRRAAKIWREGADVDDLIFITGVGRNSNHDTDHPSLREYVQEILLSDFTPPIKSGVPRLASGTVVLDKARIVAWACEQ